MAEEQKKDITSMETLPIMPLRNTVVFPHQVIPLAVGREKSLNLLKGLGEETKIIGLVAQQDGRIEDPTSKDLYKWGTAAMILKMFKMPDGSEQLIVQGLYRFKINQLDQDEPFYKASVTQVNDEFEISVEIDALILNIKSVEPISYFKSLCVFFDSLEKKFNLKVVIAAHPKAEYQGTEFEISVEIDALILNIKSVFQNIVDHIPYLTNEHRLMILNTEEPSKLGDLIASQINFSVTEKQHVLEINNVKDRLEKVHYLLNKELQILELGSKIQSDVQGELNKTQRQYYLREQLKAIKRELGEFEDESTEIEDLR